MVIAPSAGTAAPTGTRAINTVLPISLDGSHWPDTRFQKKAWPAR